MQSVQQQIQEQETDEVERQRFEQYAVGKRLPLAWGRTQYLYAATAAAWDVWQHAVAQQHDHETYRVLALSTGHLTQEDCQLLEGSSSQMIMKRDAGFFVKLYEDDFLIPYEECYSETFKDIIRWAHQSGYRMIEFDCDAAELDKFTIFDWFEELLVPGHSVTLGQLAGKPHLLDEFNFQAELEGLQGTFLIKEIFSRDDPQASFMYERSAPGSVAVALLQVGGKRTPKAPLSAGTILLVKDKAAESENSGEP